MSEFLNDLNTIQKEAVTHTEGPLMVLAGAGSGKTRVLTYRIAYLLEQELAQPWEILALTFTNKASKEMKERISKLIGNQAYQIWCGTFHSIFAQILRDNAEAIGFDKNFSILDTTDTVASMKLVLKSMHIDYERNDAQKLVSIVSRLKNNKVTPVNFSLNHLSQEESMDYPYFAEMYPTYIRFLKKSNSMDFDDLLLNTYKLFSQHPDILEFYQQKFRYVLVDEYQDTNEIQYLITALLIQKHKNICVVGDDAQSIYSFRGADIQNILNFPSQNQNTKVIKLEQNYRSTQHIVKAANSLIKHNENQHFKNVFSEQDHGQKIIIHGLDNDSFEADYACSTIQNLIRSRGVTPSDIAVLYRTNAQSRPIEDQLRRRDIQYKIFGGMSFFQRAEIKDIISYIRLSLNHNDMDAFNRVVNVPARGIGKSSIDKINAFIEEHDLSLRDALSQLTNTDHTLLSTKVKNGLSKFKYIQDELIFLADEISPVDFIHTLLDLTQYKEMYDPKKTDHYSKIQNIEEFINAVEEIELHSDEAVNLTNLLEKISLATDVIDTPDENEEVDPTQMVSLMTLHMSKGLEFRYIFIVGVEKNILPSPRSMTPQSIEEERRLFYVGITRAQDELYLSYARSRKSYNRVQINGKSDFLEELDQSLTQEYNDHRRVDRAVQDNQSHIMNRKGQFKKMENTTPVDQGKSVNQWEQYSVGSVIKHSIFGIGKIQSIMLNEDAPVAHVSFNKKPQDIKRILLNFSKLELVE